MRAVIVDDERLAREELRRLLAAHPDIEIVAEGRDADEAEALLAEHRPDLLFLDIQMPGRNGLEMLESLDDAPLVIFTTAFEEYALRAFEVSALDYLLKPVAPQRLARALARARERAAAAGPAPAARLGPLRQVFVREGERCWLVRVADIKLLQSEGNYTRVHFGAQHPLVPRSLAALEARLDPETFFRANRAAIVNLRWVAAVTPEVDGGYALELREGPRVAVSRRQARRLREILSL
ncbi:MAG TPA: LytTR family DNA-binding domain-containing protein [Terriglobales bacterium]|nr:LytTR family DNA-binding domain-containing protein [Terriglobales bacterium]